jgi:hypothetical protein
VRLPFLLSIWYFFFQSKTTFESRLFSSVKRRVYYTKRTMSSRVSLGALPKSHRQTFFFVLKVNEARSERDGNPKSSAPTFNFLILSVCFGGMILQRSRPKRVSFLEVRKRHGFIDCGFYYCSKLERKR